MTYLLDTNTCIFLAKNNATVLEKYIAKKNEGIAISTITVAELEFGVANSTKKIENSNNLTNFLLGFEILDFDNKAAFHYGKICADLRKKGTPIGTMDMLIAAHAKSQNMVLVTNNTREFTRVVGLEIEDWLGWKLPLNYIDLSKNHIDKAFSNI